MKHCKILRYLFTAAALLSGLGFGLVGSAQPALAVTDLAPSHWAASTINAYVSRGIMSGYPDGTFRPEASVTRAEFVKMVNSVFGYNTPAAISFPDVSASYWGYDEIAKGVYAGYINGDESGKFNPDAPLTREEAASIICRIKGLAPNQSASSNYTDSSRIASWAAPYVGAATQFGYMQGNGDGTFNPTKALTRAEAATVLAKAESSKTYTTTPGSSGSSNNNNNNNNANNNVLGKPGVSNSTNTDKVKDYTMSTRDKTLANKTITGNLYIPSGMSSSTINLDDLTVEGTVYVRGGSTIDVDDCDFNKVVIDKSGVSFITDTHSTIDELEFWRNGRIEGKGYGEVTIADNSVSSVNVNATVDSLLLDTDSDLRLGRNANIEELEVTSKANNANVYFSGDAYVDEMRIYDHIDITGSGEINKMYTYVSGIYSSIEPNRLITSGSGTKPSYTDRYDDDDDDDNSNNNNNNNNNNKPGSSNTPSDKNLVVTGNIDGSDAKKGNATYDTVTVTKAGVTISNIIIDKNLTIEASVADGNVTLDHVTIKGQVYIHGGGQNSIIFSDCALEKNIYIDKKPTDKVKQPVGLKLNNGTTLKGDIILQNNANITTSPKEYTLNSVVVNGTLTEPLKIDANIDKLTVNTSSNLTIELDNSNINNLVAKKAPVTAKGSGNINDVSSVPNLNVDMLTPPDENTKPDLPNFKAIISLSGIPEKIEKGGTVQLNNIQAKYSDNSTATISNVEWKVTDDKAGVTITDNLLTATKTGSFTLIGTVKNGVSIGKDFVSAPFKVTVTEVFISAEKITANVPTAVTLKEEGTTRKWEIDLKATDATVTPSNASNKDITWSVKGAGATINKDNVLILTEPGEVTLTATVLNGKPSGNLTQVFKIKVDAPYRAVKNITLDKLKPTTDHNGTLIYQAYAGTEFTLSTTVTSDKEGISPTKSTIEWTLVKSDNTGITQDNFKNNPSPTLKPTNPGEIVLNAVIEGGANEGRDDYEQEIRIKVNPSLVGEVIVTPAPLKDVNTYYPGQTITFKLDDKIMDAYEEQLEWSINNQKTLDRYITDKNAMPTLTQNKGIATLTIPASFPTKKDIGSNLDIEMRVNNTDNRDAYRTVAITVAEFIPVTNITNKFETEVTMPSDEMRCSIDLSKIEITPTDATLTNVEWTIKEGSDIAGIDKDTLVVTSPGKVIVTATIANGTAPGTKFTKDFEINIAVPLLSDIIVETEPFEQLNGDYLAGQVLTFTMHKTVMETHGANIDWSVSGSGITTSDYTKDSTTNKLILTIPATFNGGTITVKAENTDNDKTETKKLDITAKAFTSFDGTTNTFTISKPTTTATTDVKIGGTLQLSYTAKGITEGLQTITWGFAADGKPNSTQTKIDDTGKLTIASNETAPTIKVVATMANGKLVGNELKEVLSDELPINIDLGKVSIIEAITKPPLTDNTYYIGQKITFRVDNGAAGYGNITWDFANQTAIAENTTGTMPTFSPTTGQEVTLTIPNDFRISGTLETLDVRASINGVGSQIMKIKVVPFTPVESINITAPGVTNNTVYVEVGPTGGTSTFTADVKPDSRKKDYMWVCTLDSSSTIGETKIENGVLTIDSKRTTAFPVYATIKNGKIVNGIMQEVQSNKITVNPFTSVTNVAITCEPVTPGKQFKFTADITPANSTNKTVTWKIEGQKTGTTINPTTGSLTLADGDDSEITVTATITNGKLENGTRVNYIATVKFQNGSIISQTTKANPFTITKPTPTEIPPTNQYEEEEEEEDYKYNDDKKTAAELERERIEAEKEAQRKRQSAPKIGGGVKKNTVSAD